MLEPTKAAIKVFLSRGHVPILSETECPYCGRTHTDEAAGGVGSLPIERRPILSAKGNLLCRNCGRRLDHDECESCDRDFETHGGDAR